MRPRTAYGFGIVRTIGATTARQRLAEICDALSRALSVVVFPQQTTSYRELADALDRGTLGLAWLPPLLAIELEERRGVTPLALPVRRGNTSYHAALIARRGEAKGLDDLRGKRVAWVDRESAAGYVVPRMHLVGAGFDVQALFSGEVFVNGHDAVIDAVLSGRVDVGATFCTVDPRTQRIAQAGWTAADGTSIKPVEVVALMGPIPNDVLVAASSVPPELAARITELVTALDSPVRAQFEALLRAEGFRPATRAHFDPLRRMLDAARARADAPPSSRR